MIFYMWEGHEFGGSGKGCSVLDGSSVGNLNCNVTVLKSGTFK